MSYRFAIPATCLPGPLPVCLPLAHAAPRTADPSSFRLTIELQDGSRLVGKPGDSIFQLRSDLLSKFSLPLERIRSLTSTETNSFELITANRDSFTVDKGLTGEGV